MAAEGFNKQGHAQEQKQPESWKPQEIAQQRPENQQNIVDLVKHQRAFASENSTRQVESRQNGPIVGNFAPHEKIAADSTPSPAVGEDESKKIGQATPISNRSRPKAINAVETQNDDKKFSMKIATTNRRVYTQFDTPNPDKERSKNALVKHMNNLNTYTLKYAEMLRDKASQQSENTEQVIDDRRKELAASTHSEKTGEPPETLKRELRRVGNRKREVEVYQKDGVEHIRYQEKDKLYKYRTYEEHQEVAVWLHNKELKEWTYNPVGDIHDKNANKPDEKPQKKDENIEELHLNVRVRDVTVKDSKGDLTYKIESIEGEKCYSTGGNFIAWRPAKTNILSRNSREASIRSSLIIATLESRLSAKEDKNRSAD